MRTTATGVVRTERRLTRFLLDRKDDGIRFVVWHRQGFRLVPEDKVAEWIADPPDAPPREETVPAGWRHRLREVWRRLDRATTLHLWRASRKIYRRFVPPPPPPFSYLDELPVYAFQPGDVYVNCAMILNAEHCRAVEAARAQGVKVVIIGYDIIAVLFPQFYPSDFGRLLAGGFRQMVGLADFIPCISRCTERDINAFAQREGCRVATGVLELGCDGVATALPDPGAHPTLARLKEFGFVAMVGTFEVRKNHGLILKIWATLSRESGLDLPPLVIAGMRGWCVDGIIVDMQRLPIYGEKVFWLPALSDRQVAWLFKHCAFSVYPSLYEGWGLPVAEGLSFSRPVLCSNGSSLPEVAKGLATLLDPGDEAAWTAAIRRAIAEYVGRPVSINYPRQTWDQAGREFYGMIQQVRSGRPSD